MIQIVWEFVPAAGRDAEFERAYAGEGAWARLFARSAGYRGTTLARDSEEPRRYLVIDQWDSAEAFLEFQRCCGREYAALDRECEALRTTEKRLGAFDVLGPAAR